VHQEKNVPRETERNALVITAALVALGKLVEDGGDSPALTGVTEQIIWYLAAFFLFVAFVAFWHFLREEYNIDSPLGPYSLPMLDHRFLYSLGLASAMGLLILLAK
jgi:hypothetical protein